MPLRHVVRLALPGLLAAACFAAAHATSAGTASVVVLAVLSVVCVIAPAVQGAAQGGKWGIDAPDWVSRTTAAVAAELGMGVLPVFVNDAETGQASVRGLTRRTRRVQVSPGLLDEPAPTVRAVIAHELAHALEHHQVFSLLGALVAWLVPAVLAGLAALAFPTTTGLVVVGAWHAVLTVAGVVAWCHAMREQEFRADALAARCSGVAPALHAHLERLARQGWSEDTSLLSMHPSCARRAAALRELGRAR